MKDPTTFQLEVAVNKHLHQLDHNFILNQDELDELYDHLISEVEVLTQKGLSDQEAFEISKMRLGDGTLLQSEYKKVKPISDIYKYLLAGLTTLFCIQLIRPLVNLFDHLSVRLFNLLSIDIHIYIVIDITIKCLLVLLPPYLLLRLLEKTKFNKYFFLGFLIFSQLMIPAFSFLQSIVYSNRYHNYRDFHPWNTIFLSTDRLLLIAYFLMAVLTSLVCLKKGKTLLFSE